MIENFERVNQAIQRASARAGRTDTHITLVAATKYAKPKRIVEAIRLGLQHVGENHVQDAEKKKAALASESVPAFAFHLLGALQTNKARRAVKLFDLIQSVDRVKIAAFLNRCAEDEGKVQDILIQIKLSAGSAKSGVSQNDLEHLVKVCQAAPALRLCGLMGVADYAGDAQSLRPVFQSIRDVFERFKTCFVPWAYTRQPVLSMGMSHDFEIAVEEGANMVRIGSALFEEKMNV